MFSQKRSVITCLDLGKSNETKMKAKHYIIYNVNAKFDDFK